MTLAMGAQADNSFDYEGTISLDTERGREWIITPIGVYLAKCNDLLELLEGAAMPRKQVDEHHKKLAKQIVMQIIAESHNAVEQAAITAMVGTSLLATFDAQCDLISMQLSMFDAEDGEPDGTGR